MRPDPPMPRLTSIAVMNALAIFLGLLGLSAIPDAILMAYLLTGLGEIPSDVRTALLWQAMGVISGTLLLLSLALWLATRASAMWRARKAALANNASE